MSTPTIPTPGQPAQATVTAGAATTPTVAPKTFDAWMRENAEASIAKPDEIYIERPKLALIAAGRACEHLKAAIAIGMQHLPLDKFSTTNAIELARFIYEIESDMTDELVTEEEEADDDVDDHSGSPNNHRAGGITQR